MAEALAIEGAKWVASTIVTSLLKEGLSYLGIDISTKLQELEITILPQFQLVIEAAERSSVHKDKFQLWLRRLKDAVYEAEDVLDLYKYQLLEEEVSDLNTRPALKPFKRAATKVNAKLCILSPQKIKLRISSNKLDKIKLRISLNKLEEIAAEAKTFRELLQIPIGNDGQNDRNEEQPKGTSSFPLHTVFGRDKELGEIIKNLLDPSEASEPEKSYSVVAIVGMGGAGKTTLAQLIYNDPRVAAHFDVKMWVCVSRKLEVDKHTKHMIESSGKSEGHNLETLQAMQSKLVELVKSNKILLVLDDVWFDRSTEETEKEWLTLVAPLAKSVKSGSKILVTTRRTDSLPVALRPQYSMALKDLEENHILSLFKLHAFGSTKLDGSRLQDELMTIGKQIVQKLHGSPLAAKAVGCQLSNTLNVGAWRAALKGDNLGTSQQALLWSYQRLDALLQRCFSYFSLFPKGHKYEAEKMVHLWIAEGFINSFNSSTSMEDIGMKYFDELVSGSFLQKDRNGYYMHNLFHDLAEKVSKEDCLRIEDDDQFKEIPPTIRRLSIFRGRAGEIYMSLNKLENLRTLMIEAGSLSSDATADLLAATEKYKSLRVLMIDDVSRETLTQVLPNLKHLRMLMLNMKEKYELPSEFPATLGKLYHLQVLCIPTYVNSLPKSLKNLINLRYFDGVYEFASLPDVGRLTSLQTLSKFVVKKEKGHDIGQLKNLNELRGRLRISNLENVEGKGKAAEANLQDKRHLENLQLEWGYHNDETDLDMEVLEGLQPHPHLTKLTIRGYKSPSYPSWSPVQNLRSLELLNCTALEFLPPIGNSFPNCSKLEIQKLYKLREFPSLPQSLNELVIVDCPSLIIVSEDEVQKSDDDRKKFIMTTMQSYQLINGELNVEEVSRECLEVKRLLEYEKVDEIPKDFMTLAATLHSQRVDDLNLWEAYCCIQEQRLKAIFSRREKSELILPSSLQSLELDRCNITDGALSQSLQGLTSLEYLELHNISSITTLPAEEVLHHLSALTRLNISGCPWLKSLGGLYAFPSLEELEIRSCPCLELEMVMPLQGERGGSCVLPPSLRSVYIEECTTMKSIVLIAGDQNPSNLAKLYVEKCPSLASLSLSHLRELAELEITRCSKLERLYLDSCPAISSLPENLPESLKELKLWNCTSISSLPRTLPESLEQIEILTCPVLGASLSLSHLTALTSLNIRRCPKLERLYLDSCPAISSLPENLPESLKELKLGNCTSISSLPRTLPKSLKQIEILNCPVLRASLSRAWLDMSSCRELERLYLDSCPSISSLPENLPESLKGLKLWNCPSISSLPKKLPESLEQIEIFNCPVLEVRCRNPNGEDWPKIAHIPRRIISPSKMHACLKLLLWLMLKQL